MGKYDIGMEHEQNCDGNENCGCSQTVTLTLEDNTVVECSVLDIFDVVDSDNNDVGRYIALLPQDGDEVFLYRYSEINGEPVLENIESDEEFQMVEDAFFDGVEGIEDDEDEEYEYEQED